MYFEGKVVKITNRWSPNPRPGLSRDSVQTCLCPAYLAYIRRSRGVNTSELVEATICTLLITPPLHDILEQGKFISSPGMPKKRTYRTDEEAAEARRVRDSARNARRIDVGEENIGRWRVIAATTGLNDQQFIRVLLDRWVIFPRILIVPCSKYHGW